MRLEEKFKQLKLEGRKAFIAYVPFGFPNIKTTKDICVTLGDAGVDVIELGVPFSDPLADGPIIQKATTLALEKGANLDNFLVTLDKLKQTLKIPIVVMSYYNPVFNFGTDKFLGKIKQLGVSGVTIVDLPLEESRGYIKKARSLKLETIFFITPTTSDKRMKKIVSQSEGFIYYISLTGITGMRKELPQEIYRKVRELRRFSKKPICVGFGISNPKQAREIAQYADGIIVGSAVIKIINDNLGNNKRLIKQTANFVRHISEAVHASN